VLFLINCITDVRLTATSWPLYKAWITDLSAVPVLPLFWTLSWNKQTVCY
jgi:hypothetical protein